jgi:glycerol-3-phosphate dehydrogenase
MQMYGSDAVVIRELAASNPQWQALLHPDLPYIGAEVIWAVRHELARTVEDVLARRTRALLLNATASMACAPLVATLMAQELGHDQAWIDTQVATYRTYAQGYTVPHNQ